MKSEIRYLSFALACLTGCAATVYAPPSSINESASLEFMGYLSTFVFFPNGEDCTGHGQFPEKFDPMKADAKPLPIPANQKVAVHRGHSGGFPTVVTCDLVISFTPKPGQRYRSLLSRTEQGCVGAIQLYMSDTRNWVTEPTSIQRKFIVPFFNDGPWCK